LIAPESAKPGKHIGGKYLNKITQMGNIVYIGESGSNKSALHDSIIMKGAVNSVKQPDERDYPKEVSAIENYGRN